LRTRGPLLHWFRETSQTKKWIAAEDLGADWAGHRQPIEDALGVIVPGRTVYDDIFGNTHIRGFCFKIFPDGSYAMRRDSAYNYSRKVRTKDLREGAGDDGTTA